jgi:hypothetical protein
MDAAAAAGDAADAALMATDVPAPGTDAVAERGSDDVTNLVDASDDVGLALPDGSPDAIGDAAVDGAAAAADFFSLSIVHQVAITIDAAEWQRFMAENMNLQGVPTWHQADFQIDGVALQKVGFKTFGFGSRLFNPNKPNLNLDLNKYFAGQSLQGISRMRIKNNGQDPTSLRQAITYEGMRAANLPAPRATFAQLVVNNEPYGFYSVEEAFTGSFVHERTGNENGAAYEADDCQGFVAPAVGGCTPAAVLEYYTKAFNPFIGTGEDLQEICNVMNGPAAQFLSGITALIDLDEWIGMVAADTALAGDYDGFSTNGNNYRLYHDTATNKMLLFIFGPDVTYDADYLPFPDALTPLPGADCVMRNPTYRDIFLEQLRASPEGLARYQNAVKGLRTGPMSPTLLKQRVDTLWSAIGDRVKADPRRVTTVDPERSKEQIKIFVDQRATTLEAAGM